MSVDLIKLRREYCKNGLKFCQLNADPFLQFEAWMSQAVEAQLTLPNAMSLASGNADEISLRTVLLKSFDEQGFVFFTNYQSKKALQIQQNSNVALLFSWLDLERQIKISGKVEKLSKPQSEQYFASRPRESQLGAWASKQSSNLSSRQELLDKFAALKLEFKSAVPKPDFWGGYRVIPISIEFWQGRENRLHDRFVYKKTANNWEIQRLAP
ncbi:MAG: pyridoxamine 5'-phosphate oxidase [Candidatus Thioglobus sp.]|nr:pyridoxamine 5'-phosphate oxidase [Candidatus Thioglobus sp.]